MLTSKSKKRTSSRISRELPAKRLRVNETSSTTVNQEKLDANQWLSSSLKEMNHNFSQLRKQIASLAHSYDQHQQTLNLILKNQKKITEALRDHKVKKIDFSTNFSFLLLDSNRITR